MISAKNVFKAIGVAACAALVISGIPGWISLSNSSEEAGGNTIVSVMFHVSSSSKEGQAYKKCVDAFNEAYKDKKIKATASYTPRTDGSSAYETALISMKLENKLPDIITFDSPKCSYYAANGYLYNINNMVADIKDEFYESSLNYYNGEIYGLPIQESSAGFYYNKTLFKNAGISDKEIAEYSDETPWTYAEFASVCERLKSVCEKAAVNMNFGGTADETTPYLLYPFIYASGGEFASEDGKTVTGYLDSDDTVSAFSFFKSLLDNGYTSDQVDANDFYNGKAGMYLSSGWTIADLRNKNYSAFPSGTNWGLLPYPCDVPGCAASATGSWSFGITQNHHSDKSAARELLKWLVNDECSAVITEHTGMISAKKNVNEGRY
ncbi:MAG: extracellular solute-binding protein, partial [Clostridia bacterium]|nr:extracellular solute-binding protein [Clostridia bacterium]